MSATTTIEKLCEPIVKACDVELWAIQILDGPRTTLRVLIEKEGGVTIDKCAQVSRGLSLALDAADAIPGAFTLEVSSPGMDRPLIKPAHYVWALGKRIQVTLRNALGEKRRYHGKLLAADASTITVEDEGEYMIPMDDIAKAKVLID